MDEVKDMLEQAELNTRVKQWMNTVMVIVYCAWGFLGGLCVMVGVSGYIATNGRFGDLLIIVGVVALVKLFKSEV